MPKSAKKTAGKKRVPGVPFTGKGDPRNGKGPAPGTGGRPPEWFKAKMAQLATKDETLAFLEALLDHPTEDEVFLKALTFITDRWMGRPTQRQELTGKEGGPVDIVESPRESLRRQLARLAARGGADSGTE